MARYFATFRIKQQGNHYDRWRNLNAALMHQASYIWTEPTSFIAFQSERTIDAIALSAKNQIDTRTDMCLIRMIDYSDARYVGALEDPVNFKANFPLAVYV